jgi:hypothetical protein
MSKTNLGRSMVHTVDVAKGGGVGHRGHPSTGLALVQDNAVLKKNAKRQEYEIHENHTHTKSYCEFPA